MDSTTIRHLIKPRNQLQFIKQKAADEEACDSADAHVFFSI